MLCLIPDACILSPAIHYPALIVLAESGKCFFLFISFPYKLLNVFAVAAWHGTALTHSLTHFH